MNYPQDRLGMPKAILTKNFGGGDPNNVFENKGYIEMKIKTLGLGLVTILSCSSCSSTNYKVVEIVDPNASIQGLEIADDLWEEAFDVRNLDNMKIEAKCYVDYSQIAHLESALDANLSSSFFIESSNGVRHLYESSGTYYFDEDKEDVERSRFGEYYYVEREDTDASCYEYRKYYTEDSEGNVTTHYYKMERDVEYIEKSHHRFQYGLLHKGQVHLR